MAFVKMIDEDGYSDPLVMETVIRYIIQPFKTENNYIGGLNILPLNAEFIIEQFQAVKTVWHKTEGKQIRHFVVSFAHVENVSAEEAYRLAYFIAWYYASRYQIVYSVHEDTEYVHIHFVFNTVSFVDGLMYAEGKADFARLQEHIWSYLITSLWKNRERPEQKGIMGVNGRILF